MSTEWEWFLKNVLLVAFVIYALQIVLGIEFNEYPHTELTLFAEVSEKFDSLLICPSWNEAIPSLKANYEFDESITDCKDYAKEWTDLENARIQFVGNYQIIVREVRSYNTEIDLEVVYLNRAFILFHGNKII